jgi:hypothetical protein
MIILNANFVIHFAVKIRQTPFVAETINMSNSERIANIICFLTLIFGENENLQNMLLEMHPDYLIEKFERYIESSSNEYPWGLHPVLRQHIFHRYTRRWELELQDSGYEKLKDA